ncbi:hypothetical protein L9F63_018740 [Diploptera punctata]|uniref:Glucose-methanol-choline oxidoreductase N-terminal domain-containing protein n=1 Tax=Diploptera punctata TaxID=6984 RepID=A0AAD8EF54_DIPPU|nr:hypothetical protein L9F63_018740 [Diploptera punctata]
MLGHYINGVFLFSSRKRRSNGTLYMYVILCMVSCNGSSHTIDNFMERASMTEGIVKFINEGTKHHNSEPPDQKNILPEYDFIIVGAGSAGCAIANRLSQISKWKVLLIEAGRPENYIMDIPMGATFLQFTEANWMYKTEPSEHVCLSMDNRQCSYPRGKAVGGSSAINYMIATRGSRKSYDYWEELGNPGWGYKDLFPYFLEIEDMTIPELARDTKYHSTGGELAISRLPYQTDLAKAFVESGKEIGYQEVDYNGMQQIGFSLLQTTTKNGTRWSASKAFLHPIRNRRNFHLKKRSLVTKILIDPVDKRACGVEFVKDKKTYRVRASKEVIVSGGAINSPQLLMLSGIGPKKHLQEIGIPVVKDLNVGYNLMDHPGVVSISFLVNQSVGLIWDEMMDDGKSMPEYLNYHTGKFSVPAACEAIAFVDTENPGSINGDPDLEFLFFGGSIGMELTYYKVLNLQERVNQILYKPIFNRHAWTAVPITLKPKSRGRVVLRSRNPFDKPLIYHNLYEDPYDLEIQLKGVKKIIELSKTKAFQKYGSSLSNIPVPGCEGFAFGSDDYWRCVIRHMTIGIWHLSGTCKMGPSSHPGSVVDARLKVYGMKGLRVADASIMPMVPNAHTNIPSMVVGLKAADMIMQEWMFKKGN